MITTSTSGLRVLHFVYSFTQGGAQRVAMSMAAGFPGSAVCSLVKVPDDQLAFPDLRRNHHVEHYFTPDFESILHLMQKHQFDMFHVHWCGSDSDTTNLKVIDWGYIKTHSDFPYVVATHVEKSFPHIDITNIVCEAVCQQTIQYLSAPLIPNGFDLTKFVFDRSYSNKKELNIGFVSRLDAKLDPDFPNKLKNALARVEIPTKVLIIGDGEYRKYYERGLQAVGMNYEILGLKWDVHEYLKDLDIFLYPTKADCLPTVVIEAMASGLPVVAPPIGDIPYMLGGGRGYALPWEEMPDILQCLTNYPEYRRMIGMVARKYALDTYAHKAMIENWETEYRRILKNTKTQSVSNPGDPVVSIVIPTYGRPEQAYSAAQYALSQDIPVEVIVVNDGDHDSDYSALQTLGVKYIKLPRNRGLSVARNVGIAAATGQYIGFCDDDDRWYPFFAGELLRAFTNNDQTAVAYGNGVGTSDVTFETSISKTKMDCGLPFDANRFYRQNFVAVSGTMVRKSVLDEVGGFDENLHINGKIGPEDLEMWLRLTLLGYKFVRRPIVGLVYNTGDGRATTRATKSGAMRSGIDYIAKKLDITLHYPF